MAPKVMPRQQATLTVAAKRTLVSLTTMPTQGATKTNRKTAVTNTQSKPSVPANKTGLAGSKRRVEELQNDAPPLIDLQSATKRPRRKTVEQAKTQQADTELARKNETLQRQLAAAEKKVAETTYALRQSTRDNEGREDNQYNTYYTEHSRPYESPEEEEDSELIFSNSIHSNGDISPSPRAGRRGGTRPTTQAIPTSSPLFATPATISHATLMQRGDTPTTAGPKDFVQDDENPFKNSDHVNDVEHSIDDDAAAIDNISDDMIAPEQANGTKGDKLADYSGVTKVLLANSIKRYEVRLFTRTPYPTDAQQAEWTTEIWALVCEEQDAGGRLLTHAMSKLMTYRGARVRGAVRDAIRPSISEYFGFKTSSKERSVQKNIELVSALLMAGAFRYLDPMARTGLYEPALIYKAIKDSAFANRKSIGVEFVHDFSPIPASFLAFVCVVIEFCLKEWSSGSCQHSKLDESVEGPIYANFYLPQVEEWIALDPNKVKKKLQRWYLRARHAVGAPDTLNTSSRTMEKSDKERAAEELKAKSGDTDTEEEESDDDDKDSMVGGDGDDAMGIQEKANDDEVDQDAT